MFLPVFISSPEEKSQLDRFLGPLTIRKIMKIYLIPEVPDSLLISLNTAMDNIHPVHVPVLRVLDPDPAETEVFWSDPPPCCCIVKITELPTPQ